MLLRNCLSSLSLVFFTTHLQAYSQTPQDQTSFVFFGDWGMGNREQRKVAQSIQKYCSLQRCDFVTALGDNFYPVGVFSARDRQFEEKFEKIYGFLGLKFYVALGNHDHLGNIQGQIDYTARSQRWYLPKRYYQFRKQQVEFFVLDTDDFDKKQREWLADGINASDADWIIVFGHHPILSQGPHGDTKELVQELLPILKDKVDFYLSGHDHSKQIFETDNWPVLAVSGAAAETTATRSGRAVFASSTLGFGHLDLKGSQATMTFVDEDGVPQIQRSYNPHNLNPMGL